MGLPLVFLNCIKSSMTLLPKFTSPHMKISLLWSNLVIPMGMQGASVHCGHLILTWWKCFSWHRAVITLCNKGDCILAAEWTYPSALVQLVPLGITVADVAIDGQGIRADSLRSVLRDWDEVARGAKRYTSQQLHCSPTWWLTSHRPHVLYIIPVGQNPTGAVSSFFDTIPMRTPMPC